MRKIFTLIILAVFSIIIGLILILSTFGIETSRFNNLATKKITDFNEDLNLQLNTIKFKLDIKEISLFLLTEKPKINIKEFEIPTKNIKVYIDFSSILKSEISIKKISLSLNEIEINELKRFSFLLKPSNLTSFISNKVKEGKILTEIELFLTNENLIENYIAKGKVSNFKAEIIKNITLEKTNFDFFADRTDILFKNISGETGNIKIEEGDLKIDLSSGVYLESNFKSLLNFDKKIVGHKNLIKKFPFSEDISNFEANLNNIFSITLDKTYKLKNYNFKSNGKISKFSLALKKPFSNDFLGEAINKISIVDSDLKVSLNLDEKITLVDGKYSFNESDYQLFKLENNIKNNLVNFKLNADYNKHIYFELINYEKPEGTTANLNFEFDKNKENINVKEIKFSEGKNIVLINNVKFKNKKFLSLKKIKIKTNKSDKINNDFLVNYGKKILISGNIFDATNLPKILNRENKKNILSNISKEIEIDFSKIQAPLSEQLNNFKLIGKIENGKFVKISSKGDFENNKFLDISMKNDKINRKKYLEIYSDITKPFLTEYNFFKGLTGGNLLYSSIIDEESSISKLKIENFKVVNAPGLVKLLSLADLGGLADLAEGEGISFDILEISMEKKQKLLKLNEILALGPSISVLMEGYQNPEVTSIRGTLVPAKNLNKLISKIPLIGSIVIPKEVGEGIFGVSFKVKGPPGKIKTSINPIRTLTPRFIQKIIDKSKNTK